MRKFSLLFLVLLLLGCESVEKMRSEVDTLKSNRDGLRKVITGLDLASSHKKKEIAKLDSRLRELKMIESGKQPHYVLKLKLKQSRMSLDFGKHMKDSMNAIKFELPVSKSFYEKVNVGEHIVNKRRDGSLILHGSFGHWKMTVVGKSIR